MEKERKRRREGKKENGREKRKGNGKKRKGRERRGGPQNLAPRGIFVGTLPPQKWPKMHFRLLQICVPEALEPRSCSSRRCPEEDVMLRTFILAGCAQPSEGLGECYRRESAEHQPPVQPEKVL